MRLTTLIGPLVVTVLALAVAIMVLASKFGQSVPDGDEERGQVLPVAPVSVRRVRLESIEITDSYSGMIRPRERFSLGFEIAGRVERLGTNQEGPTKGSPLDEGDRVKAGEVLAQLDDRVLRARLEQAQAQLEQAKAQVKEMNARLEDAQSDMARARELRRRGTGVITDAEYQDVAAQLAAVDAQTAAARAQQATALALVSMATKNLEDSTLVSPVSGVISKRSINAGESVSPQQPVMEVIQVDEVLLVAGVPEAYVGEIHVGQGVHVELLARDRFGRRRPATEGRVYQVAEAADQTTGLFEVETLVPNPRGDWKPGLIALARIVVDRVDGFRIPTSCAMFRQEEAFVYLLDEVARDEKAFRFGLRDWIEEGSDLVIPIDSVAQNGGQAFLYSLDGSGQAQPYSVSGRFAGGSDGGLPELPEVYWTVVSRGQHRLVDGQGVRRVRVDEERPGQMDVRPPVPGGVPMVGSRP